MREALARLFRSVRMRAQLLWLGTGLFRIQVPGRAGLPRSRRKGARYDLLTQREREAITLVVTGLLNKKIGAELGTTKFTIKVQRGRVMEKMRAGSLVQSVRMAEKLGIPLTRVS
jgi:FixJ family two-component response regulator